MNISCRLFPEIISSDLNYPVSLRSTPLQKFEGDYSPVCLQPYNQTRKRKNMHHYTKTHPPRGGAAHRQAEWREYHPVSRSAGMRVGRRVGKQAYSKIAFVWARVWAAILRLPCRAVLEDGRAGSISMSLDFFGTFCIKTKSTEEKNMNARLYDPVIGRFFSPDNYVQIPEFTQDFNRYSYARNNPLAYTDPSGNSLFAILFFPVRILTEGLTWLNDKMNGDKRPNGYFNMGYLLGVTEPGGYFKYNPVNAVPFGHPLYTPPFADANAGGVRFGTGFALGADNEWDDWIFHKFNEKEYERRIGSKKLMWLSQKAATASGIVGKTLSRISLGIYAGKFEGINVFETHQLGTLEDSKDERSGGVTLPGIGIIVGKGVLSKNYDRDLLKHEYGHILQFQNFGYRKYYGFIGVNSLLSAARDGVDGWNHNKYWIETYANMLSSLYFSSEKWNDRRFPVECPSYENWLQIINY
jgi:RHS repeat-associated protein